MYCRAAQSSPRPVFLGKGAGHWSLAVSGRAAATDGRIPSPYWTEKFIYQTLANGSCLESFKSLVESLLAELLVLTQ